ncbi:MULTISPECIES: flagellar export chaperone FlgN [unclassified Candidatus Frackibacter]|uniref:flagellar export chaperone FlgN n=1 Tax=unclassified Candidatus Frackibacter TaxID=2648818 RepID=UPI000B7DF1F0|nr:MULTISPECIES: flagellar export chaperone FlgN [unclassified Candidatus Frackibacter]
MKDKLDHKSLINEIINIYKQELLIYKQIFKLTKDQQQAIEKKEWQNLKQIIEDKEKKIDNIEQLEAQLISYKKQLAQQNNLQLDANEFKEVIENTYQVMHRINKLEKDNREQIINQKNKVQKKMKDINTGLNINRAYDGAVNNYEGKFIDNKK